MVKVPRYFVPRNGWSYKLRTAPIYLRLFIPVLISYFYLIIYSGVLEE